MATPMTDLIKFVYEEMLRNEIKRQKKEYFNNDHQVFLTGIKSIDNLPCNVWIGLNMRTYTLKIESEDLLEGQDNNDYESKIYYSGEIMSYSATAEREDELEKKEKGLGMKDRMKIIKKEDVELCINKLIVILNELKFNTYKGVLMLNKDIIPPHIFDVFKSPNVVIVEADECAVCYEKTLTKTWCKHSVCYKCMENIPLIPDAEAPDSGKKPCPLCRADIIYPPSPG